MPSPVSWSPARDLEFELVDGCRVLRESDIAYLDGGEDDVLSLITAASDRSSMSDELVARAETWPEEYHLSKSRANVLRPFELSSDSAVLEIGAGCGAITRYLGETCRLVDALEPVIERARVCRARCEDLDSVEVFAGEIDDLPVVAHYDYAFVIGVLEYVANGGANMEDYSSFLSSVRRLLKPGGICICAIENKLGVKYLAGSPEDHSGVPMDSIDDYPRKRIARTFSRRELCGLFDTAGFSTSVFHAFPDYKMSSLVFSDQLLTNQQTSSLAWRMARLPSPDRGTARPRIADEARLWRGLIDGGVADSFSNSFIVEATTDQACSAWPEHQLAVMFNYGRRSRFATRTNVEVDVDSTVAFDRTRPGRSDSVSQEKSMWQKVTSTKMVPGIDLPSILETAPDSELEVALSRWSKLVFDNEADEIGIDLVPHNIIVDGPDWHVIDQEWHSSDYSAEDVVARGSMLLGMHLGSTVPAQRWSGATTVEDVVRIVGEKSSLTGRWWLSRAMVREARFQALVNDVAPDSDDYLICSERRLAELEEALKRPLAENAVGSRIWDHQAETLAWGEALEREVGALRELAERATERAAEFDGLHRRERELRTRAESELAAVHRMLDNSAAWQVLSKVANLKRRFGPQ